MTVQVTVPKNANNRSLRIEADSDTFFRSSDIELDGDKAPVITEVRLRGLPTGEYVVIAVLRDNLGTETAAQGTASVLP